MTEKNAADKKPVFHHGFSGTLDHGPDGADGPLVIVRCGGEPSGEGRVIVFDIREPDGDIGGQQADGFLGLIATGVIYHGDGELSADRLQGLQHGGKIGGGGHQVDVVGTFILQFQEDFRKPAGRDGLSEVLLTDFIILAEAAPQGAAGEEYRAAAALPADNRLFPWMKGSTGYDGPGRRLAEALLRKPVDAALPRTEGALPVAYRHIQRNIDPFPFGRKLLHGKGRVGRTGGWKLNSGNPGFRADIALVQVIGSGPVTVDHLEGGAFQDGKKVIGNGVFDGTVAGTGDIAALNHIPEGDTIAQKKGPLFGNGLRDRLVPETGDKSQEPVAGMTVKKVHFPGFDRGKGTEYQNA